MNQKNDKILEKVELPRGLEVDIDEGWRKLIRNQFGGSPGRCIKELIQNFLDSYPESTPWENRKGEIHTSGKSLSIIDYGEGMDRKRLRLIVTLGGTDKRDNPDKIGKFGIGFLSIFNPKLGTKKVVVTTQCENSPVEVTLTVEDPEKKPAIAIKLLDNKINYSTKVEVFFDNNQSPLKCLFHAEQSLKYYPCRVTVNGNPSKSIWEKAEESGAYVFKEGPCHGVLKLDSNGEEISILSKYEHITDTSLSFFISGGHDAHYDIRDYHHREVPFVPGVSVILNSMDLKVTIGRDSYYLGYPYENMIEVLKERLLLCLKKNIDTDEDRQLVLANQYIFRKQLAKYINRSSLNNVKKSISIEENVIRKLAEAKVYRLNGRKELYSLVDIKNMSSFDLPVYYCPLQTNLRWVGGAFKHDYIILPAVCDLGNGTPDFYDRLFETVFKDVVNLDKIGDDHDKIEDLVERDIVDKSSISPECEIVGERNLSNEENRFLEEVDSVLCNKEVKSVISKHLHLSISSIQTAFFEMKKEGAIIATGLFDKDGVVLSDEICSNFKSKKIEKTLLSPETDQKIILGLNRAHPLLQTLMASADTHRTYYTLTFIAHELTLCQKLLAPNTPFYHAVKEKLATDMRRVLMLHLLSDIQTA